LRERERGIMSTAFKEALKRQRRKKIRPTSRNNKHGKYTQYTFLYDFPVE